MWNVISDEELKAVQGLQHDSDRAAAIVCASLVETHLERALTSILKNNPEVASQLFRSSGPLGSFSAKIRLAYLMSLISDSFYRDLSTMKDVRNRFAHEIYAAFDHPPIRDRCRNLVLVDEVCREPGDMERPGTTNYLASLPNCAEELKNPRRRYVLSAGIFTAGLANVQPRKSPAPWL